MEALPVILLLIGSVAECLELYRVDVPHYKRVGESAELRCEFHLGRDRLYAVKWYKDNEEFFRYVPRFNPSIHTHSVPGVHVDIMRSTAEMVVLKSVGVRSTGVYRCEVSAEAPSFASFMGEGRMTVVYLPKEGPQITGNLRDEYEVGDMLDLNCTSSKSFPPARISWYINDSPVISHTDSPFEEEMSVELFPASNGKHSTNINSNGHNMIKSTSRRLLLELTPTHFGDKGTAKIRCIARIFPLFWQDRDEKDIDHKGSSTNLHKDNSKQHAAQSRNINKVHNSRFNTEITNDDGNYHRHQLQHEPMGSLYKGEALVQIRGGSFRPSGSRGTLLLLLLLIFILKVIH